MFGLDKEVFELKAKLSDLEILLKLLIATQIKQTLKSNSDAMIDSEINNVILIVNKLQEKLLNAKKEWYFMEDRTIEIKNIGQVTLRKLTTRDWEIIRNEGITIDPITRKEIYKSGTFIKILVLLGVQNAPFYKSEYPQGMILTDRLYNEREQEYYAASLSRDDFDLLFTKVKEFNEFDDKEIVDLKKKAEH